MSSCSRAAATRSSEPTSVLDRMGKGNLLYVLPGLVVYAIFVFFPILAAVGLSLTEWNGLAVRDTLHAGQQLVIWVPESQTDSDTTEGETSDEETTDTTDDTADTNDTAAEGSEETEAASQDEILNAQLPDQLDAHPENKIRKITYHARRGDSIAKVAKRFDVTQAEVIRWNNLKKDQRIKRGKSLVIYVDITDTK